MIETAKAGVSYGVEVKWSESWNEDWTTRYGWFPEDGDGLERAQANLDYALESNEYEDARIVRRIVEVEVIE